MVQEGILNVLSIPFGEFSPILCAHHQKNSCCHKESRKRATEFFVPFKTSIHGIMLSIDDIGSLHSRKNPDPSGWILLLKKLIGESRVDIRLERSLIEFGWKYEESRYSFSISHRFGQCPGLVKISLKPHFCNLSHQRLVLKKLHFLYPRLIRACAYLSTTPLRIAKEGCSKR